MPPLDNRRRGARGGGRAWANAGPEAAAGQGRRLYCTRRRYGGGIGRGALVEPAIVAALVRNGGHGYDLRKTISEMTDDVLSVDAGGLYRILRRMEEEGLVTSTWVEGDSGPQKREYELTAEGLELAEDWIAYLRDRAELASMLADELQAALDGKKKGAGKGSAAKGDAGQGNDKEDDKEESD